MADAAARRIRYGGLAGAALVAAASWLVGALPAAPPPITAGAFWRDPAGPLGLAAWFGGVALWALAWWRGRAVPGGARWGAATLALWAVPLLLAAPLGSRDVYSYACQGELVARGLDPYAATPATLPCRWVGAVAPLWRDTPAPYGPVFLALAGAAAVLGGGSLWVTILLLRLAALLPLLLVGVCLARPPAGGGSLRVGGRGSASVGGGGFSFRTAWLFLGCPLVGAHLLVGAHNDALMIGLLVAGLVLAVRALATGERGGSRLGWLAGAGALVGAAVAVKATAAVALPFLALGVVAASRPPAGGPVGGKALGAPDGALRGPDGALGGSGGVSGGPGAVRGAGGRWWVGAVGGAGLLVVVAAVVLWGAGVVSGFGVGWVAALRHTGATTQWSAPFTAVGMALDHLGGLFGVGPGAVPVARGVGVVVFAAVAGVLALAQWRGRLGLPAAVGGALAAAVLCAPVLYPWYVAWPLAALALAGGVAARRWALLGAAAALLALPDGAGVPALTKPLAGVVAAGLLVAAGRWLRRGCRSHRPRPAG
ncbi:hypothetical protein GCM10010123_12820 [Pilimelia anulata]|uniref:DUF2029 domain-containing protein n=1 Tax=Pilimelia anulata TaxID=53371 RepID=A0A8J3FBK2_9ACTN|nr:polyprenol phosphomannose-dependent alpha 1,6 mannosyltransferase MptB [Pilimelia anulata]GGJ84622.1 hypothetical protein GCM10010123_12820 [Pilimelia anulata]